MEKRYHGENGENLPILCRSRNPGVCSRIPILGASCGLDGRVNGVPMLENEEPIPLLSQLSPYQSSLGPIKTASADRNFTDILAPTQTRHPNEAPDRGVVRRRKHRRHPHSVLTALLFQSPSIQFRHDHFGWRGVDRRNYPSSRIQVAHDPRLVDRDSIGG